MSKQPEALNVYPEICETCEGVGTIDETLGGYAFSNPKAQCPDCDGKGAIVIGLHDLKAEHSRQYAEIERLRTEAVAADIRIANDALVIAGLTAERDALARCKLADQDAYVAMRYQRDAARADALRYRYLRDDCLRARWQDTAFVNAPSKWLPEHQTTTAEDDAAIDAAIRESNHERD